jgi:HAE1 family hydrophobic/amphiphilic exporter-1
MLIGTMIGILVIPTMFVIFQTVQERISHPEAPDVSGLDDCEE